MNLISTETIQSTFTYINLGKIDPKHPGLNNRMVQQMLLKRTRREAMSHQMTLWRNGMAMEPVLSKNELLVLGELMEAEIAENDKKK